MEVLAPTHMREVSTWYLTHDELSFLLWVVVVGFGYVGEDEMTFLGLDVTLYLFLGNYWESNYYFQFWDDSLLVILIVLGTERLDLTQQIEQELIVLLWLLDGLLEPW